jgi:hypothetical protein
VRRTRTLVAVTAAVVATVGGITVATATADPAAEATSTRAAAAAQSGEVTAAAAPVATASKVAKADAEGTPTKIVWTRRSTWVTYGNTALLEGQVQIAEGALPGVTVKLYARSSTSKPWTYLASDVTDSSKGLFRFDRKPPRNYYFGVAYEGNGTYDPSSATTKVGVRRDLTPSYMTSAPRGNFYYYGKVRPSQSSLVVKLEYKKCGSCSYSYLKYTRTNSNSAWKFTVSGPSSSGRTYYYRAYTPSSESFLAGYADEWKIQT